MKRFLKIILATLLLLVAIIGYISWRYSQSSKNTSAFVEQLVTDVSKDWNPETIKEHTHALLAEQMAREGQSWEDYFLIYRKLGALKSNTCKLLNYGSFAGLSGSYTRANFTCSAIYENGGATINLSVQQADHDGSWQVAVFHITSPMFIKILQQ